MDILCGCRGQVGRKVAVLSDDGMELTIMCKHKTFVTLKVINGKIEQVFNTSPPRGQRKGEAYAGNHR